MTNGQRRSIKKSTFYQWTAKKGSKGEVMTRNNSRKKRNYGFGRGSIDLVNFAEGSMKKNRGHQSIHFDLFSAD